jgi:hypothetical protein
MIGRHLAGDAAGEREIAGGETALPLIERRPQAVWPATLRVAGGLSPPARLIWIVPVAGKMRVAAGREGRGLDGEIL